MSVDDLDIDAVRNWVDGRLDGFDTVTGVHKFDVGQSNPTYKIETPAGGYVLRRKPPGKLLKSAHAVDREFRVQSALADTDVPVSRMHLLCEEDEVIGSAFYIMDFIDGVTFRDPALPQLLKEQRSVIMDEMNRVLCAIHRVNIHANGLSDFGAPGAYYKRQLLRWTSQYRSSVDTEIADMEDLITWLSANVPKEDGLQTLVHGDFRIDNLLFDPDNLRCVGVLDWELSTLGHPNADLAGLIMQWQLPAGEEGRGLAGIDRVANGLMSDRSFIATYCARMSQPGIPDFRFYLAFAFFRMAAILQGVKARALLGNASNPAQALKLGAYVPVYARLGLDAIRYG